MDFPVVIIGIDDKGYPEKLRNIAQPPKKLYCRGNLSLLSKECIAVVGTRKFTSYGKEVCQTITRDLANAGFVIVSGLALGIDSIAHQATLEVKGKTIAILGGGVDDNKIGPRTNLPIAKEILKNDGLLISEYGPEKEIFPANFAARDRIISGTSVGVLVIEAGEKSGALITAQHALDQNRDVFAVPGSIFSDRSIGTNSLIKKGAKIVTSSIDIIEDYGYNTSLFKQQREDLSTKDPVQTIILDILDDKGSLSTDEIIRESKIETPKIMAALSILELSGNIKQIKDRYEKN